MTIYIYNLQWLFALTTNSDNIYADDISDVTINTYMIIGKLFGSNLSCGIITEHWLTLIILTDDNNITQDKRINK